MLKKHLSLFLLLFFFLLFAQVDTRKEADSLIALVSGADSYEKLGEKDVLRITTEIYYKSRDINYKEGQLKALDYRSNVYYNTGKISQAMYDLDEGMNIAKKLDDYYELAYMMFGKAFCYTKLGLFKESVESVHKGFEYATQIKDKNKYHYVRLSLYNGLLWNANVSKNNDKNLIIKYTYNSHKEAELLNEKFPNCYGWKVQSACNYAAAIVMYGNNDVYAEKLINDAEKMSEKVADSRSLVALFIAKGLLESKKKDYPGAVENFHEAVRLGKKGSLRHELPNMYWELSKSYESNRDFKNASLYLNKSKNLSDSLVVVEKKSVDMYFRERAGKKSPFYYIIIISVIIMVILFLYIIKKKKINREDPVQISEINEPASDKHSQPENYTRLVQMVKENDPAFYLHFKNVFPEFIRALLSVDPQLKTNDLEYCALIRLNFDTKQIAVFKNTSVKAVENKKYRLKKKLHISTDENLYSWMAQYK